MTTLSGFVFLCLVMAVYSAPGLIFALPGTAVLGFILRQFTGSTIAALCIGIGLSAAALAVVHGASTPKGANHYYWEYAVVIASFYCWPMVLFGPKLLGFGTPKFYDYARQQATVAAYERQMAEAAEAQAPAVPHTAATPTTGVSAAQAVQFGKRAPAQPWGQERQAQVRQGDVR